MYRFVLTALLFCIFQACNTTNDEIRHYDYLGWVTIVDNNTGLCSGCGDNSGIKATLIETGEEFYTDTSGVFWIKDIPEGSYSFKYEYDNYPVFYHYGIQVDEDHLVYPTNQDTSFVFMMDFISISPLPKYSITIDSVRTNYEMYGGQTDSVLYIYTTRYSDTPIARSGYLLVFGESESDVNYPAGNHNKLKRWITESRNSAQIKSSHRSFPLDSLESYGFEHGDNVFIRYYPLNSIDSYKDPESGKEIFPYRGTGSNIISVQIP